MRIKNLAIAALLGLMGGASGLAHADAITYQLTVGNPALSGLGPFGQATVTLIDSTHASVLFTTFAGYTFTDGGSVAINVNGSFSVTALTGNCTGCSYSNGGAGNENGFGSFNLTINSGNSSPAARSTSISFTLTDLSGTWASASAVTIANGGNNVVAAHICQGTQAPDSACAVTGFATQTGGQEELLPEPGMLSLLGIGMLAFGFTRVRRSI